MDYYPITVVDNFYKDPDKIRDYALKQDYIYAHQYSDDNPVIFPGKRSADLNSLDQNLFSESVNKFLSVLHDFNYQSINWFCATKFQSISKEYSDDWIHDDGQIILAGIVYLTPDAPLNSGTSIYKKNELFNQDEMDNLTKIKRDFYRKQILPENYIQAKEKNNSMFTETVSINNVYNRLVIYEGKTAHGGKGFFGDTLENSRLTQVFFLDKLSYDKESFPVTRSRMFNI